MFDMPRDLAPASASTCAATLARPTARSSPIASEGEPIDRALRAAAPRRQSAAAGGNRPRIREALRFYDQRRRLSAVCDQRRNLRRLGAEARLCPPARRAGRVRARQQDGGRPGDCGFGAMSRGSCIRWTTAGSPIGATPSSSSPAAPPMSRSSPTIRANGRSNRRSPNIARPEWGLVSGGVKGRRRARPRPHSHFFHRKNT